MNRIIEGFKIYQKKDISLLFADDIMMQFEAKSKKKKYLVANVDDVMRCDCPDFTFRFEKSNNAHNGSFLCKHCYASLFLLAEIKGMKEQHKLPIHQTEREHATKDV